MRRPATGSTIPRLALAAVLATVGCRGTARLAAVEPARILPVVDSLVLARAAGGVCADDSGIVVLESGGERLVRFSPGLVPQDTIAVPERVNPARGVAADRFYYYFWDDRILYRMAKDKLQPSSWLGNVRVAGIAGLAPGEMLVSDGDRGVVWYKTLFGESRRFIGAGELSQPGALAALPGGRFCAISAGAKLVWFDRSGIVGRSTDLPVRCDLLAASPAGVLALGASGQPEVWVGDGIKMTRYQLSKAVSPTAMVLLSDRLLVLDSDTRLFAYALP